MHPLLIVASLGLGLWYFASKKAAAASTSESEVASNVVPANSGELLLDDEIVTLTPEQTTDFSANGRVVLPTTFHPFTYKGQTLYLADYVFTTNPTVGVTLVEGDQVPLPTELKDLTSRQLLADRDDLVHFLSKNTSSIAARSIFAPNEASGVALYHFLKKASPSLVQIRL